MGFGRLRIGGLIALDGLGVAAVWAVCEGATGAWFTGANGQDRLAAAALMVIWHWRLAVLAFRVILQPDAPPARAGGRIGSIPVRTIYRGETSKIRPVRDTLRFLKLLRRI